MTMTNYDSSNNYYSKNSGISSSSTATIPPVQIVDAKTLVSQTQDRMWKALEGIYLYDSSLQDGQAFPFNHVNSKISLVIMYTNLVGST
jgi:hypothetical protein